MEPKKDTRIAFYLFVAIVVLESLSIVLLITY